MRRAGPGGETRALIDTSPDLRWQLIDAGIDRLDGVLITHPHADHTHGIDDLRPLAIVARRKVEIYMDAPTSTDVRGKFDYVFTTPEGSSYPPIAREHRLVSGESFEISGLGGGFEATPFELEHGDIPALGFRIGGLAYTPDLNRVPEAAAPHLENLEVWVIDALRYAPHPSHLSLVEALALIARFRPRRAVLTNLHTDLDYRTLDRETPANVTPAYDGMVIEGF